MAYPFASFWSVHLQITCHTFNSLFSTFGGFPRASMIECTCQYKKRQKFPPWVRKISWRRKWQPTPVFWPEILQDRGAIGLQKVWHDWALHIIRYGFLGGLKKKKKKSALDAGLIPGWERSPGEGNGTTLQSSCLENPMERGAWQATVYGVAKSPTQLIN